MCCGGGCRGQPINAVVQRPGKSIASLLLTGRGPVGRGNRSLNAAAAANQNVRRLDMATHGPQLRAIGRLLRRVGQSVDRVGLGFMGDAGFVEHCKTPEHSARDHR